MVLPVDNLDDDVLTLTVSKADVGDLLPLALSCKRLHRVCRLEALWRPERPSQVVWWTHASTSKKRLKWAVDEMRYIPDANTLASIAYRCNNDQDFLLYWTMCTDYDDILENECVFRCAGASGFHHLLRVLIQLRLDLHQDEEDKQLMLREMLMGMAHFDRVESFPFVDSLMPMGRILDEADFLMEECIHSGSLKTLKYLFELKYKDSAGVHVRSTHYIKRIIKHAVADGRVDILEYLHDELRDQITWRWSPSLFDSFVHHDAILGMWTDYWDAKLCPPYDQLATFQYVCEHMMTEGVMNNSINNSINAGVKCRDIKIITYLHVKYFKVHVWPMSAWRSMMNSHLEWMGVMDYLPLTTAVYSLTTTESIRFNVDFVTTMMTDFLNLRASQLNGVFDSDHRVVMEYRCRDLLKWMMKRGVEYHIDYIHRAASHGSVVNTRYLKETYPLTPLEGLLLAASTGMMITFDIKGDRNINARITLFKDTVSCLREELEAPWQDACMLHVLQSLRHPNCQYPEFRKTIVSLLKWMMAQGATYNEIDMEEECPGILRSITLR
tara:strand:+ start:174 stop:1835 length:1662 start_codon:yes stop_codon:yes gene_type:complete